MRPYRKEKVASRVRDIVSETIAFRLQDPRIETFTTVTRVEITGDLLSATVFLSIPGGEGKEGRTLAALRHATGFLRRVVAEDLQIRQCPDLRFEIDKGWKKAQHTMELLEQNRRERADSLLSKDEVEQSDPVRNDDGQSQCPSDN